MGNFVEQVARGRNRYALAIHVNESAGDEGVGDEGELSDVGVNGGAEIGAVGCGAGLEGEREDESIDGGSGGGVHMVEEREGIVVAALVHVRGQELGVRQ